MEEDRASAAEKPARRVPWNEGKLVGAKPPLRPNHVWSIRTKLQMEAIKRNLALLNLAIDSKLRGSDVVAVRVDDVAPAMHSIVRPSAEENGTPGSHCPTGSTRPTSMSAYMSTRHVKSPRPFFFSFFLPVPPFSCSTAPQAFSRPDRVLSQAGARRCCQGWPLFSGHTLRGPRPLQQSSTNGRLDGSDRSHSCLLFIRLRVSARYSDNGCCVLAGLATAARARDPPGSAPSGRRSNTSATRAQQRARKPKRSAPSYCR
jgi:hypothetical protein